MIPRSVNSQKRWWTARKVYDFHRPESEPKWRELPLVEKEIWYLIVGEPRIGEETIVPKKIESQEEQFPDRVAEEKAAQQEDPYLRMQDIDPRITFDMGGDPEKAKRFEDAFTRKMLNEAGDPSLPQVPPRGQSPVPLGPQPAGQGQGDPSTWNGHTRRPMREYQPPTPLPRPDDYAALEPSSPEDWEQLARIWYGPQNAHVMDTPRKMQNRIKGLPFHPWDKEDWHPYEKAPDKWQQYADYKRGGPA